MNALNRTAIGVAVMAGAFAADVPTVRAALENKKNRKLAPSFTLKDAAGKPLRLSDYRGRVVLLNFWATWCGGCKIEIPWFQQFEAEFGRRQFGAIGVSLDEQGWAAVKPYMENSKVTYRMALGDTSIVKNYAVTSLPATFLIDRMGRVAAAYVGLVDRDNLASNIRELLKGR